VFLFHLKQTLKLKVHIAILTQITIGGYQS
jgi:hypothetical protein